MERIVILATILSCAAPQVVCPPPQVDYPVVGRPDMVRYNCDVGSPDDCDRTAKIAAQLDHQWELSKVEHEVYRTDPRCFKSGGFWWCKFVTEGTVDCRPYNWCGGAD